jgi:hypothetical protein
MERDVTLNAVLIGGGTPSDAATSYAADNKGEKA